MKIKMLLLLIAVLVGGSPSLFAQGTTIVKKDYPEVGKQLPAFTLTNVDYYLSKTFAATQAKGKWLILDFWGLTCKVCVQSFPKINQLQEAFKGKIQFLIIGDNRKKYNNHIKQVFDRYTERLGLKLASAYDSVLIERFGVNTMPHVIIVDPFGKVYAITSSASLTHENLEALIAGKAPMFHTKQDAPGIVTERVVWKYWIDRRKAPGNELSRSVLSAYKGEEGVGSELIDADASRGFFQTCGVALGQLYKYAWFGQPYWVYWDTAHYGVYWPDPVLEVHDTALFQYNYDNNRGFYNYSLLLPHEQATREELMARMQYDLVNCFGYTATIETRLMPYWRLTITEAGKKKLKSIQAKAEVLERGPSGLRAKGITIGDLLDNIRGYNKSPMAILDETGFTSAIDINLVAALIDINDMRSAFLKEGLVLEESRKPMQVLVVKDKGAILRLSNNK